MSVRRTVEQAALWVVGVDESGAEVVRGRLGHGERPEDALAARGFTALKANDVWGQANPHELTLVYAVRRADGIPPRVPVRPAVDERLVVAPGEQPVPYQRVAAYAVVRSSRGILLSQASARTNAPGSWGLCGGGVDPGELPEQALHREVWEETGQRVELTGLAAVHTRHWVGRAPSGRLEDFHAVRVVYHARCAEPTDPVVHDADGTTAAAAWVTDDAVLRLPLTPGWRDVVLPWVRETP